MDLITLVNQERIDRIERALSGSSGGDFEGSVTGSWVGLDDSGAGLVRYNSKLYKTKRLGFTSIPAGTAVQLSFAAGIYYSQW